MDNPAIARILREIADLLEIKGENPFKIRAYRNGADITSNHPHDLSRLNEAGLREIPGIGKDLAARIREIADTGATPYHQELLAEFPATILDVLRLQGVGPKTVATLYKELGVGSLDDLERAIADGRIRALRGMGTKKEGLLRKALDERKRFAGRHLISQSQEAAGALIAYLLEKAPDARIEAVGSLRRGCETCGDVDLLASNAPLSLLDDFVDYPLVERVLGHGDAHSSVLIQGGFQADLRLVAPESQGAAMQYFTGSKAHNIALRDRAMTRGLKLNEYGLFRAEDQVRLASEREEDVYAALGLDWIAPELREMHGEIDAAEAHTLPQLIDRRDLRGDLHMHTTETDGKDDIRTMAEAAKAAGLEYIAITDHSQSLAMANGLDETRALAHAARIRAVDAEGLGIRVLAGIECDIKLDGSLDLADDCLAALDIVVASVHSGFAQDRQEMTDRVLRAIENRHVDILGHPTGRMLLKRDAYPIDMEAIVGAAARTGMAMEINSQAHRLDMNDVHARLAHSHGVRIVISSDAHSRHALTYLRWGVLTARRAWLQPADVLNTKSFDDFRAALRRHRRSS
ncbi:MAG TPA: DNA polymerase/3'-5' exonuclease PolX [Vicinamibacterales bacterium]